VIRRVRQADIPRETSMTCLTGGIFLAPLNAMTDNPVMARPSRPWFRSVIHEIETGIALLVGAYECDQTRSGYRWPACGNSLTHGLTLVTRNETDVSGLGATVLNPFRGPEHAHKS